MLLQILILIGVALFATWFFLLRGPKICKATSIYPQTVSGKDATVKCPAGQTGSQTATCQPDGTFLTNVNTCKDIPTSCPATGVFTKTLVGATATADCPAGFSGTQTAECRADGTFADAVLTGCIAKPTNCAANAVFPSVTVGEVGKAACAEGYTGERSATCNTDGTFGTVDTTGCKGVLTPGVLTTPWNAEGGYYMYLDRHNVACPAKSGMADFQFLRDGKGNIQEKYQCLSGVDLGEATGYNATASANIWDPAVEMKCPTGSVLNQWHVNRPTGSTLGIDYKCVTVPNLGACTEKATPWNGFGNGHIAYLDRHKPECPANSMLSRVKLENDGKGQMRYSYTCCQR